VEDLLRPLAPEVLGALTRRCGRFDECEDAVQEALLAAAMQWPREGFPDNPRAWLITVASRRLTDLWRTSAARRAREETVALLQPPPVAVAASDEHREEDDTLELLLLCCHPALTPASQIALTLRAVAGLSTTESARAFLVPEATMAQRISRAKQTVKASGEPFGSLSEDQRAGRLPVVLQVLYLIFNEGYSATSGRELHRRELTREAIRLVREVRRLRPRDGEVAGLLALMLLAEARHRARTTEGGALVPIAEQDRRLWDRPLIDEGIALVTESLSRCAAGPYQLQAAIAAVHAEASSAQNTDWPQILALYELLERIAPNPVVTLNRAVAVAMVRGAADGLAMLERLAADNRMKDSHRVQAVRAHLLELAGDESAARAEYLAAARRTTSLPERRYLEERATRIAGPG
jgi:RNA polymerase sigma factor (sigma-70 family)